MTTTYIKRIIYKYTKHIVYIYIKQIIYTIYLRIKLFLYKHLPIKRYEGVPLKIKKFSLRRFITKFYYPVFREDYEGGLVINKRRVKKLLKAILIPVPKEKVDKQDAEALSISRSPYSMDKAKKFFESELENTKKRNSSIDGISEFRKLENEVNMAAKEQIDKTHATISDLENLLNKLAENKYKKGN